MRLSLPLLLMVVAACCAPNSPMGPQAEACPQLGDIGQTEIDLAWPDNFVLSTPTVNDVGEVICNKNTPHIGYINHGKIVYAESMVCKGGQLTVPRGSNSEEVLQTARVRCYRKIEAKDQPENPIECPQLGDIGQTEIDLAWPDNFVLSTPTVNDVGEVICNKNTPHIGYINHGKIVYAESMVCKGGQLTVPRGSNSEEVLQTARVRCYRKIEAKDQPENPIECHLLGEILQDKFDKAWPEYAIVLSTPTVNADGNVICNSDTPHIGYISNGAIAIAKSIVCKRGEWHALNVIDSIPEEVLQTARVRCYSRVWRTNQPENPIECPQLGEISQDQFDIEWKNYFTVISTPNVTADGHVICNSSTPHIGYISNEVIAYAERMVCEGGKWHVSTGVGLQWFSSGSKREQVLETVKARCYRRVSSTKQPEDTKECTRLSEIPKSQLDTLYPKADFPNYVIEGSLPTVTADGRVTCHSSTRSLLFVDKNQKLQSVKKMMCLEGKWYVQGALRTEALENAKASCFILKIVDVQ